LFEHLPIEKAILKKIDAVIDQKGKIRPNASRELMDITMGIAKAEQEARKKIDQVFKAPAAAAGRPMARSPYAMAACVSLYWPKINVS
jgi:DNA mismatch repair protein MutS2